MAPRHWPKGNLGLLNFVPGSEHLRLLSVLQKRSSWYPRKEEDRMRERKMACGTVGVIQVSFYHVFYISSTN